MKEGFKGIGWNLLLMAIFVSCAIEINDAVRKSDWVLPTIFGAVLFVLSYLLHRGHQVQIAKQRSILCEMACVAVVDVADSENEIERMRKVQRILSTFVATSKGKEVGKNE